MTVFHYTSKDRLENIMSEGLKTNSNQNLTLYGGNYSNWVYGIHTNIEKPLYFCLNNNSIFKNESEVVIEVNLKETQLVADLQSLVDKGAIYTEDGRHIYFKNMPQTFKDYGFYHSIKVSDLLEVGNPAAEAAIQLTKTGVYLNNLNPQSFLKVYGYEGFGLLGNCVNSFDADGNSLIDIFSDVSDFAYVEDNSFEIDLDQFLNSVHMPFEVYQNLFKHNSNDLMFLKNSDREIYMAYDQKEDIHYFFKECKEELVWDSEINHKNKIRRAI